MRAVIIVVAITLTSCAHETTSVEFPLTTTPSVSRARPEIYAVEIPGAQPNYGVWGVFRQHVRRVFVTERGRR